MKSAAIAILWILLTGLCAALLCGGCTRISYGEVHYLSVLQRKSLSVTVDESGRVRRLDYNTAGDPAVEALARLVEAQ